MDITVKSIGPEDARRFHAIAKAGGRGADHAARDVFLAGLAALEGLPQDGVAIIADAQDVAVVVDAPPS